MLQNRAVRFITFSSFRTTVAPLYACLKILPLNEMLFLQKSSFIHSLHYNNIPYALSAYCKKPEHRYPTRYKTSENYILPKSVSNRGQTSIKYTGPKAWSKVPLDIKEIAFRKPFSKRLKEHILSDIYVELPPRPTRNITTESDSFDELRMIFETNDEEDFFGFENIFQISISTTNFLADDVLYNIDLSKIFLNESTDSDFLGF